MRRDWWKIRHVLLELREGKNLDEQMTRHSDLCVEAGFIRDLEPVGTPKNAHYCRLTWEGHEAATLLEDVDVLHTVLDELDDAPWEVLRERLIRYRWPKQEPRWPEQPEPKVALGDGMFHWTEEKRVHVPQTKLCPLCEGSGRAPKLGTHDTTADIGAITCPVCHGARVIKE